MPSSTSFHVGICTFSLFFALCVYVCVCVLREILLYFWFLKAASCKKQKKKKRTRGKCDLEATAKQ